MLSFGCMVERQSEPLKGEPAAKRGVGSTRLQSCEASHGSIFENRKIELTDRGRMLIERPD